MNAAEAAFLPRGIDPGEVGVVAVHGATDDFSVEFLEFFRPFRKVDDFGRTDEREIERIEEKNGPLSSFDVLRQRNVLELATYDRFTFEFRGGFLDKAHLMVSFLNRVEKSGRFSGFSTSCGGLRWLPW